METLEPVLSTTLFVFYENTDISREVSADLLSFSYTDKIDDESDEVSLTLKDPDGKWAGLWSPTRGDKVEAIVFTEDRGSFNTGSMTVDNLSTSGSPRVFQVRAVSIPLQNTIRRTAKTRNFENATLKDIAQTIAKESELELLFDSEENPTYDRIDQRQESDLSFLKRLCDDAGLSVKVSYEKLILFDQASYEKKEPIKALTLNQSPILSWSFNSQQSQRYRACTVKWRNVQVKTKTVPPSSGGVQIDDDKVKEWWDEYTGQSKKGGQQKVTEYIDYTYEDETVDESGQVFVIKKRCSSQAEAERIAKAKLRQLNLRQTTGNLTVVGDPLLVAGGVISLVGFGSFDGKFFIEQADHSIGSSGYTTSVQVRRVNENY